MIWSSVWLSHIEARDIDKKSQCIGCMFDCLFFSGEDNKEGFCFNIVTSER